MLQDLLETRMPLEHFDGLFRISSDNFPVLRMERTDGNEHPYDIKDHCLENHLYHHHSVNDQDECSHHPGVPHLPIVPDLQGIPDRPETCNG